MAVCIQANLELNMAIKYRPLGLDAAQKLQQKVSELLLDLLVTGKAVKTLANHEAK